MTEPLLQVVDLTVSYPAPWPVRRTTAVDGVSFVVPPGGALGVVGESGSGKSTIARVVAGVLAPTSGEVLIDGRPPGQRRSLQDRWAVQMVFQDPGSSLNPRREVGSVLDELVRHRFGVGRQEARRRSAELLDRVGLPRSAYASRPAELSGGQRQRASIARALAVAPSLLVADEATSALDPSVQARILALFGELRSELGITLVLISHNLAVVNDVCDDVLVLQQGGVVESGPCSVVLASPARDYTRQLIDSVLSIPDPR